MDCCCQDECDQARAQWDADFLGQHPEDDGGATYVRRLTGTFANYLSIANRQRMKPYMTASEKLKDSEKDQADSQGAAPRGRQSSRVCACFLRNPSIHSFVNM